MGTGRNITVAAGSYIVTWNYTVTPSNPLLPSYIFISMSDEQASVDALAAPRMFPIYKR